MMLFDFFDNILSRFRNTLFFVHSLIFQLFKIINDYVEPMCRTHIGLNDYVVPMCRTHIGLTDPMVILKSGSIGPCRK
jgi:hypothetical protein